MSIVSFLPSSGENYVPRFLLKFVLIFVQLNLVPGNLCQINHRNNYRLNNLKLFGVDFSASKYGAPNPISPQFQPTWRHSWDEVGVKLGWSRGEVEVNIPGDFDRAFSTRDISSSLSESDKYAENIDLWSINYLVRLLSFVFSYDS